MMLKMISYIKKNVKMRFHAKKINAVGKYSIKTFEIDASVWKLRVSVSSILFFVITDVKCVISPISKSIYIIDLMMFFEII